MSPLGQEMRKPGAAIRNVAIIINAASHNCGPQMNRYTDVKEQYTNNQGDESLKCGSFWYFFTQIECLFLTMSAQGLNQTIANIANLYEAMMNIYLRNNIPS